MILTRDTVIGRTRQDNIAMVKNLNCWGSDLTDISILRSMPSLEVVSLSVNQISSLQDFSSCIKLREIYLRKNVISNLSEIYALLPLRSLNTLWLIENPCAEVPDYRAFVIKTLPWLKKLDNEDVTSEEREQALRRGDLAMAPCNQMSNIEVLPERQRSSSVSVAVQIQKSDSNPWGDMVVNKNMKKQGQENAVVEIERPLPTLRNNRSSLDHGTERVVDDVVETRNSPVSIRPSQSQAVVSNNEKRSIMNEIIPPITNKENRFPVVSRSNRDSKPGKSGHADNVIRAILHLVATLDDESLDIVRELINNVKIEELSNDHEQRGRQEVIRREYGV